MANLLFKEEWFKIISATDQYEEDRNRIAWAVLEYLATGKDIELDDVGMCYEDRITELTKEIKKEVEKRRLRAEAARRRREERKRNAQNDMNRPRRSKQHIYEQHPAMYLFDGFASYMMSSAYTAGRKAISDKYGELDFDKAINLFRKNMLERKMLGDIQRFHLFRDMFIRFIALKPRGLSINAA